MRPVTRYKTLAMLAILLVCTIVVALSECQVYTASSDEHEQDTPLGHHNNASAHAMGHGACLIALLPTALALVWFAFFWFHISFRFVRLTPLAFPPFIPPRTATR